MDSAAPPLFTAAVQVVDILIYKGREELEVFFLLCSTAQCQQWSLNMIQESCSGAFLLDMSQMQLVLQQAHVLLQRMALLQASCGLLYGTAKCLVPAIH